MAENPSGGGGVFQGSWDIPAISSVSVSTPVNFGASTAISNMFPKGSGVYFAAGLAVGFLFILLRRKK